MRSQTHGTQASHPRRRVDDMTSRAACAVMLLAAAGLVVAILLGAPLVSILLVGLLLLCPLLLWVPFRFELRSRDDLDRSAREARR